VYTIAGCGMVGITRVRPPDDAEPSLLTHQAGVSVIEMSRSFVTGPKTKAGPPYLGPSASVPSLKRHKSSFKVRQSLEAVHWVEAVSHLFGWERNPFSARK
jgi:hypothetical protein